MEEGPVQIITVSEDGSQFYLHEDKLNAVFAQIPKDLKVAVVSVVGAFRTGKSFLLDLMLRYLRHYDENPLATPDPHSMDWLGAGEGPLEGVANTSAPVLHSRVPTFSQTLNEMRKRRASAEAVAADATAAAGAAGAAVDGGAAGAAAEADGAERKEAAQALRRMRSGFKWRAGRERTTTGIWLWSRPFIRRAPDTGESIAVILMDTQGMFDSETTQMLTTTIFGLSTLISSFVVYNLPNQIQEDYLQNLALFSEYGRRVQEELSAARATGAAPGGDGESAAGAVRRPAAAPFQHIRLLVRDADIESDVADRDALMREMREYLDNVLRKTHHEDLRTVREQIKACFETIDCFTLPHPSLEVRRKDYDGSTRVLRPEFLTVLNYFMHSVFCEDLCIKRVYNQFITAGELPVYIRTYAALFKNPTIFPEARMLLDATAEANALTAQDAAMTRFTTEADKAMRDGFVPEADLEKHLVACIDAATKLYDTKANFGSDATIAKHRARLTELIQERRAEYMARNVERNPLKNLDLVIFPLIIAAVAFVLRLIADWTCAPWSDVCKRGSQFFAFIYTTVLVVMLVMAVRSGKSFYNRFRNIINALQAVAAAGGAAGTPAPGGRLKAD